MEPGTEPLKNEENNRNLTISMQVKRASNSDQTLEEIKKTKDSIEGLKSSFKTKRTIKHPHILTYPKRNLYESSLLTLIDFSSSSWYSKHIRNGAKRLYENKSCDPNCLVYLEEKTNEFLHRNPKAKRIGFRANIAFALMGGETKWDCYEVSKYGALGCMQFIPETAKSYGLKLPDYGYETIRVGKRSKVISKCNNSIEECIRKTGIDPIEHDERLDPKKNIDAWFRFAQREILPKSDNLEEFIAYHNGGNGALSLSKSSCPGNPMYKCSKITSYDETRRLIREVEKINSALNEYFLVTIK